MSDSTAQPTDDAGEHRPETASGTIPRAGRRRANLLRALVPHALAGVTPGRCLTARAGRLAHPGSARPPAPGVDTTRRLNPSTAPIPQRGSVTGKKTDEVPRTPPA